MIILHFCKGFVNLAILITVIFIIRSLIVQLDLSDQHSTLFQTSLLSSTPLVVIKKFSLSEFEENTVRLHVYADEVSSRPIKWHIFKLMNYYELLLSGSTVEVYSSETDLITAMFENLQPIVLTQSPKNQIFSESKILMRLTFYPVEIKLYYPNNALLFIEATSATLHLVSQLITLKGDVKIRNSYGENLKANEILWKFKEDIMETVGEYAFFNKGNSNKGGNQQFLLEKGQIKKGIKGPLLALARPQNPLFMMMNILSSKAMNSDKPPMAYYFLNTFPKNKNTGAMNEKF